MPSPPLFKRLLLLAGDALAIAAAVGAALLIRHGGLPDRPLLSLYVFAAPFLIALWLTGFLAFGLYDLRTTKNGPWFFDRLGRAIVTNAVITFILFHLIPEFRLTPRATMAAIGAAATVFLFGWRAVYNSILARTARERLLLFGLTDEAAEVAAHIARNPQLGYEAVLAVRTDGPAPARHESGVAVIPLPADGLVGLIRRERIDSIVVSGEVKADAKLARALFRAVPLGVAVSELPRLYETVMGKIPTSLIREAWFLENLVGSRRPRYEFMKRILDLTAAAGIGAIALLLLPLIASGIVLSAPAVLFRYRTIRAHTGDGVIFFRQKRMGRHGAPFGFIKFRSQVLGAERLGWEKERAGGSADPRAYPFGTFLRKIYLDELPQVWNVAKGEMSFVGPRPERPEFVRQLERAIPFYRMRELVPPGITGWAQINMQNDATVSDAPEKLQYDLFYIKNRSLALDAVILARTALALLQRSGR